MLDMRGAAPDERTAHEVKPPRPGVRDPGEGLFEEVLVTSARRPNNRLQRVGVASIIGHILVGTAIILIPILVPSQLPDQQDYIRALLYDPPPPPPPPLPKGSAMRPEPIKPEPPKPVTEKPKPEFTAPIETPQPQDKAPKEPESGVRPQDQFGSETGSDLGSELGMEGGVEGGVVGGVLGGVLGGVIGGTGTGPVLDYDSPPRPIKITRPQYPQEAFIKKVEGTVLVEILIDSQGRVIRARVLQSIPLLDAAALQTVYQWVFQPAVKHGRPVPTIAQAPVAFRIY
jgi:protein TonB